MNGIDELMRQARPGGQEAVAAMRRLLGMQASVLDRVITAFEMEPLASPGLAAVISRSKDPESVPVLLDSLESGSIELSRNSMQALGASGDPLGVQRLIEIVTDEGRLKTRRSLAAAGLGAALGEEVLVALREVVDQQAELTGDDDDPQFLLVEAIVALAKRGDHSRAPLLLELASNPYSASQEPAIRALEVAVADGMIETLATASHDQAPSVAALAAKPLFLLGDVRSCELLHTMAESDYFDVSQSALFYIAKFLGTEFREADELGLVQDEWRTARAAMATNVCYRSGQPIDFLRLVDELRLSDDARAIGHLAEELQTRTGIDAPGAILLNQEQDVANSVNEMQLTTGSLYRWGHRQEIPDH